MLFGALLNVARLWTDPRVEPAALIRKGSAGVVGVVGLFISKTDERYWLAAVTVECEGTEPKRILPGSGRIFSMRAAEVLDDEVGAAGSAIDYPTFDTAGDRALDLLEELVRGQPPGGAPPAASTPAPTASPGDGADEPPVDTAPVASESPVASPSASPPEDLQADDAALVPRALAMTGKCMQLPARLIRLEPATASPGTEVRLIGTDLASGTEKSSATLNGESLPSTGWTSQSAILHVPKEARSGRVRVTTRGRTSNSLVLTVKPNAAPVAAFSVRPVAPRARRRFVLDATGSKDPDGGDLRYEWNARVGDIASPRDKTTSFVLPSGVRSSRVTLTVTDEHDEPSPPVSRRVTRRIVFVIPSDVTFDFGERDLNEAGRLIVRRFRRQLAPLRRVARTVRITGFADFVGRERDNQRLSEDRATAVRRALLAGLDLGGADVDVRGRGESKAVAKTWEDPRRANDRRVEVRVTLEP